MAEAFTARDLAKLADYDTPTMCNALEVLDPRWRTSGFTTRPMYCRYPDLKPIVGYARTVRIASTEPSKLQGQAAKKAKLEYYQYIETGGPRPSVCVLQDLDGDRAGWERTRGLADWREQLDIGVERATIAQGPGVPAWTRLQGPNQWPAALPDLKPALLAWQAKATDVAIRLLKAFAEDEGVGLGKIKYMNAEHGAGVAAMAAVKRALDPHNLMNPGKIFPVA